MQNKPQTPKEELAVAEAKGGSPSGEPVPFLTLAAVTQLLLREAILTGSANNFCNQARLLTEKARQFLQYTDTGITILNNIIDIAKDNLLKKAAPEPPHPKEASLSLPVSSWKLFWDLISTSEFQQFFGRLLAQALEPRGA